MQEDDFVPFFQTTAVPTEEEEEKEEATTTITTTTSSLDRRSKLRRLSPSVRNQYLDAAHPEFFPIVSYFGGDDFVKGLRDTVLPVAKELLDQDDKHRPKDIGTNSSGYTYLEHKRLLQMSAALNLCMYLQLKHEEAALAAEKQDASVSVSVRHHPVLARLNALAKLADKTHRRVEKPTKLPEQLTKLVQAIELIKNTTDDDNDDVMGDTDDDSSSSTSSSSEEEEEEDVVEGMDTSNTTDLAIEQPSVTLHDDASAASSSNDSTDDKDDLITEARFGVRAQDVSLSEPTPRRRPMADYGDDEDEDKDLDRQIAVRHLAATTNTLTQKERRKEDKRKSAPRSDMVDDFLEVNVGGTTRYENEGGDTEELERGLQRMEEDLGDANIGDEDDYYSSVARAAAARKKARQDLYAVAPKYPRIDKFVDGERAISNQMLRNRGLVPHKNKLNRNPRVKKREQYRKALIRRRGAVQDVRAHEQNYGGEQTGIKSNLSRSRKLGVKK